MPRPRIVDVDYYEFSNQLGKAAKAGGRIEKTDRQRWSAYLKEHKISEVAMLHWGRSKYERVEPVIIDNGGDWDGFYVYSKDDEAVLKWERDED